MNHRDFILLNKSGRGIADYYLALRRGHKSTLLWTYEQIVFAPSNQREADTISEVSSQFFIECVDEDKLFPMNNDRAVEQYLIKSFDNWIKNKQRYFRLRREAPAVFPVEPEGVATPEEALDAKRSNQKEKITMRNENTNETTCVEVSRRVRTLWDEHNEWIQTDADKALVLWKARLLPKEVAFVICGVSTCQALNYRYRKLVNRFNNNTGGF
jgi:hypothetical protein